MKLLGILSVLLALGPQAKLEKPSTPIPNESRQMILVLSQSWAAVPARLQRYERTSALTAWAAVGPEIPVVLGKKGMGWGQGLHNPSNALNQDFRKEGDKRAPAGVFSLGTVFGLAPAKEVAPWLKMPYLHLTEPIRCIGANESRYYNQIVDTSKVKHDWQKDSDNEAMRYEAIRDEGAYHWGIFVNHNTPNTDRVSGSCIFIHLWKGDGSGTSGCTALSKQNIEIVLHWLDQRDAPVLVQLPEAEYKRLKVAWQLP
jgi:L,D-peptidoglycan transpeptidase YkuD (ErfK/YbiS/YcfS/YnhG family)